MTATHALLVGRKLHPRTVIGSVSRRELAVTVAASVSFVTILRNSGLDWWVVVRLLTGRIVAGPSPPG